MFYSTWNKLKIQKIILVCCLTVLLPECGGCGSRRSDYAPPLEKIKGGIENAGNTCYLSAVMQAFAAVGELKHLFFTPIDDKDEYKGLKSQGKKIIEIINGGAIVSEGSVRSFHRSLKKWGEEHPVGIQQDAHELLIFILENLHYPKLKIIQRGKAKFKDTGREDIELPEKDIEEDAIKISMKRATDLSMQEYVNEAMKSNHEHYNAVDHVGKEAHQAYFAEKFESNFERVTQHLQTEHRMADVRAQSITQQLRDYFNSADASPVGKALSENMTKIFDFPAEVEGERLFKELPPVLIIQACRFENDGEDGLRKINSSIREPFRLKLTGRGGDSATYDLATCVSHHGSGSIGKPGDGGHYTAHVRSDDGNREDGKWFFCNDSAVTDQEDDKVKEAVEEAYIYVYKRNSSK